MSKTNPLAMGLSLGMAHMDGTVTRIYCRVNIGQDPWEMVRYLLNNYNTYDKVLALFKLGSVWKLGPTTKQTRFFHDQPGHNHKPRYCERMSFDAFCSYLADDGRAVKADNLLWRNGKWWFGKCGYKDFVDAVEHFVGELVSA